MSELEMIIYLVPKVMVATLCGLMIGIERELKHKVAGIRTNTLVCVGACIFASIGFVIGMDQHVDPSRIIAQIVTGIGFLGAGVIFKQDDKIQGVTTAAFIWVVAAIGVLIGCGYAWSSIILTVGLIVALKVLEYIERIMDRNKQKKDD